MQLSLGKSYITFSSSLSYQYVNLLTPYDMQIKCFYCRYDGQMMSYSVREAAATKNIIILCNVCHCKSWNYFSLYKFCCKWFQYCWLSWAAARSHRVFSVLLAVLVLKQICYCMFMLISCCLHSPWCSYSHVTQSIVEWLRSEICWT